MIQLCRLKNEKLRNKRNEGVKSRKWKGNKSVLCHFIQWTVKEFSKTSNRSETVIKDLDN